MAWPIAAQMIAESTRPSRSDFKVMYAGSGFKVDAIVLLLQSIGKLGLETVSDAHEILVEAATING